MAESDSQGNGDGQYLTIGQLAEQTGTMVSALRFYEDMRLIRAHRSPGNQRRYRRDTIKQVSIIRMAHHAGIPLAEIADALSALPPGGSLTEAHWQSVADRWDARLQERIDKLVAMRDTLPDYVEMLCSSMEQPLDRPRGSSPRKARSK